MLRFCYHASRFCDFAVHNFNIPVSILSLTAHTLLQFLFDALWEVRQFPVTVSIMMQVGSVIWWVTILRSRFDFLFRQSEVKLSNGFQLFRDLYLLSLF